MLIYYLLVLMIPFAEYPPFFRIIPGYSLIKIVGAAAFGYAIFYLLTQGPKAKFKPLDTKEAKLFLLFVLFVFFSGIASYSEFTSESLQRFLFYLVFFFTTYILVDTSKKLERVYFLVIVSVLLACYRGFKEYFLYKDVYANFRPESVVGDPNYFALYLLLALAFAYYLIVYYEKKWIKLFGILSSITFLIMIIITMSRGGIIGLAAMTIAILIGSKGKLKKILLIGFCILLLIPIIPQKAWDRVSSMADLSKVFTLTRDELSQYSFGLSYGDTLSTMHRYRLFVAGIKMTLDNWITGVGIGNFRKYLPLYFPEPISKASLAHNMYIELFAELGIIGFSLFALMIIFVLKRIIRIGKTARENRIIQFEYFAMSLKSGLIGFLVGAAFLTSQYEKILWLAIFLVILMPRVIKAEYPGIFQEGHPDRITIRRRNGFKYH